MVDHRTNKDFLLAQKICKNLRARRNESILELYHEHHRFFLTFARRRLYNPEHDQIESVVSKFWTELLNAKAICDYKAKASLRAYLLTILNRRIIDANRKASPGRVIEAQVFKFVQHANSYLKTEIQIAEIHQLLKSLLLQKPINEGHLFGKVVIENRTSNSRLYQFPLDILRISMNHILSVILNRQIN